MIKKTSIIFLLFISSLMILFSCITSSFHDSYIFISDDETAKARVGGKFLNHWIIIEKEGETIFDEELYADGIETGLADFQWYSSKEFAIKLWGYDGGWNLVKIFNLDTKEVLEIESQNKLSKYSWIKFKFSSSFNKEIEKYKVVN